jgi:hypothetical protein
MARTKQTPRNRPPGYLQQQAAIAFAARNSAANAGIQPLLPLGKMVAGQDSSSSDDDRKTNDDEQEEAPDDEQEETPDDDDKSDENDDDKDDDDENPVDDANKEDDNDDAAKQTDNNNSTKAVLEIINIDNNNDTGKDGLADGSTDGSKGENAESPKSNTEAGHADEEATGILLEIEDSISESCATLPDGGTTEEAEWKVMSARKILAKLYAKDKEYEAKYKTYMNPTAGMIRPCQVGNKLAAKHNQGELYTKRNEIRK